ncbi:MAG: hypothetical protein UY20_C0019G0008 [Candidatus Yanofskybacteria bacterium GW2011_GWA1_48_10]|uniref:Uncharacterized protein n=1 Tax=Candidatus Yanofskybacteria bacterium GW2011_GWA1_48_10 TaxID=1619022 RepID=A0A0G1U4F4_9BACT|nr:MAG: hypothetical protein UY20_C0019G0008 [Candidatus Yanofskybacteria bacterium GW2011_GWA1_48_10]
MRKRFPIISNICSGRVTGINFSTFALLRIKLRGASPCIIRDVAPSTKCTVDNAIIHTLWVLGKTRLR